ncbi:MULTISPECIES: hypothetical protein [unclassified Enterococcus]|uniref:hypothetical protein n=1 Tax=unclassified Enterococcus TaxID=2608891 RepID=UPI00155572AD|nr:MULTISPECIES: hypothetical protein [unclassified Enterococcus]MBS7576845.1 hypothetical protein [Enterococcus sp. MMGLQ5-2]MBS7584252.1 hypothetical protein [Enterococcus sp. MMGLQ5-1]NPD12108.1 hypothetical protein [Enterococcus sp. MMGLQ5-1]NPD36680.1 hypothetical protein [Enterococcus sp. MMGLQ5-2]
MTEKNITLLTYYEKDNARIFFTALQQLDEKQRNILADKYYHSDKEANFDNSRGIYTSIIPNKDDEIAKQYAMTLQDYRKLRIRAESDLGYLYSLVENEIKVKQSNKLDEFVFKMGQLYVKEDRTANRDEVLMTTEHEQAKVFTKDNCYLSALDTWKYEKSRTYQDRRLLELENMNK